eukprot:5115127-Amphidinium_carterae.2
MRVTSEGVQVYGRQEAVGEPANFAEGGTMAHDERGCHVAHASSESWEMIWSCGSARRNCSAKG